VTFKLDDAFLHEVGLGELPVDEKNRMLAHVYETLEMRVGMSLAERMTNAQLDEFGVLVDGADEDGALRWLQQHFPDYKQVVAEQLEMLKAEIAGVADQILADATSD
jgi:predicted RNA-binding Zn ribbon-like protein